VTKSVKLLSTIHEYVFASAALALPDPISLVAINSYGDSRDASATPYLEVTPLAPHLSFISERSGSTGASATIGWSWNDNLSALGIGPITGFNILAGGSLLPTSRYTDTETTSAGHTCVSAVVTGLPAGVDLIEVADVDAAGAGDRGTVDVQISSPPTGLTAEAGNAAVLLSWQAPATTGGLSVSGYDVYVGTAPGAEAAAPVATVSATTALIDTPAKTLDNGVTYYFTVAAVTSSGGSAPSSEVSATPEPVPDPPTALTATEGADEVTLSWTAPSSPGASSRGSTRRRPPSPSRLSPRARRTTSASWL
jgi:hypothetical protein